MQDLSSEFLLALAI